MHKILITTGIFPPDIGGPASYSKLLAVKLGADATVLTYSSVWNFKDGGDQSYKIIRVWNKWPKGIKHLIFGIKLLGLVRKCDTVYALNVWSAGFPSLIASKIFRKKFIIRIAGDYAWEIGAGNGRVNLLIDDFQKAKKNGWVGLLYKLQGWICRRADTIIVPSKYLAGIVKDWGVPALKTKVIYNGVDFGRSDLSKEEARNKIGIHGNIILSVGRFVPWKGFRMLIKIMPNLLELNQFVRLVIVGDGPDKKNLESMIKNLGLDKRVFLVGKKSKDELAVYLSSADMFILNSGYEGFSHQILEAMVVGVPVIATAVGGNKEVIKQGENGFLVKYNDEFNIFEAIKALWNDKDLGNRFVEEGKKTINKFSSEKMVEETIKALKD